MLNHIVMWKIKEDVEDKEKVKLGIKNNNKVEQIFVDYYTYYSENKEDSVLEIINSYWEDLK